jgi:hypothetical protein
MIEFEIADPITASAPFERVDLVVLERPRLGGKEPSDDNYRAGGPGFGLEFPCCCEYRFQSSRVRQPLNFRVDHARGFFKRGDFGLISSEFQQLSC